MYPTVLTELHFKVMTMVWGDGPTGEVLAVRTWVQIRITQVSGVPVTQCWV